MTTGQFYSIYRRMSRSSEKVSLKKCMTWHITGMNFAEEEKANSKSVAEQPLTHYRRERGWYHIINTSCCISNTALFVYCLKIFQKRKKATCLRLYC